MTVRVISPAIQARLLANPLAEYFVLEAGRGLGDGEGWSREGRAAPVVTAVDRCLRLRRRPSRLRLSRTR
jgi:hypothetical protein